MLPTTRLVAAVFLLCLLVPGARRPAAAGPAPQPRLATGTDRVHGGPAPGAAKAAVDSVLLIGPWGSGASRNGQFEAPGGAMAWNGWTSADLTVPAKTRWHASTDGALAGAWSAWCGDASYPSCGEDDPAGGYGNDWNEILQWRGAVADPLAPCTVDVAATVAVDVEPGYDHAFVSARKGGARVDLWTRDGAFGPAAVALQTVYQPGDYEGPGADEVVVEFRVVSDGGWSDEDCSWPSGGAFRVDDVAIALSNGTGYAHDFEDGGLGDLEVVAPPAVGDFARLRNGLETPFPCAAGNPSALVTFVDDGLVVPGTGGSPCGSPQFCYGPGGYTVNTTGGLAGADAHLHNAVVSPALAWPGPEYDGARLDFDVWRHNLIQGWGDPAGIFYFWSVRGTADPDPAALADAPWRDRGFILFGHPSWLRHEEPIGDLLPPGTRWAQVRLEVWDIGYLTVFQDGDDASPAPWFDNVRLTAYPQHGPALAATAGHLAHDAFPEGGGLDTANPGANNVRFDTGFDIAGDIPGRNDPGDSVVLDIVPRRNGAVLAEPPRVHWNLKRNPLFDPWRTAGLPDRGSAPGWPVVDAGDTVPGRYAFDLPDTGFLFPGDVLHVYFAATDEAGGLPQTATLPADTAGFADFADPLAWPEVHTVRALPSLAADPQAPGTTVQPSILFWDDGGDARIRDEWFGAFAQLGLVPGVDYDVYSSSAAAQATGQGLGGRATPDQIAGYGTILYTSGRLFTSLGDGDAGPYRTDDSFDVQLLTAWLEAGGRSLLLTGDHAVSGLGGGSAAASAFLTDWLGIGSFDTDAVAVLDGQVAPVVLATAANPVYATVPSWRAAPACRDEAVNIQFNDSVVPPRSFDWITAADGAARVAEFADPAGQPGQYVGTAAAVLRVRPAWDARLVTLPYDLATVATDADEAKAAARTAARVRLLGDVLTYFGVAGSGEVAAAPDAGAFTAACRPNPFNPATTISWNLPRAGRLGVDVYDLRGRLVRRLVDRAAPAGPGEVRWDGRRADGRAAAAGVYFYRVRGAGHETVGKMALIK